MPEYFVVANSKAAPFASDQSTTYVIGETPQEALRKFVMDYSHPCGLYSANLYESADAYHKSRPPLTRFRTPEALSHDIGFIGSRVGEGVIL